MACHRMAQHLSLLAAAGDKLFCPSSTHCISAPVWPCSADNNEIFLPCRTFDPEEADFFYVPVYTSCLIHPVVGYAEEPAFPVNGGVRVMHASMALLEAKKWMAQELPYWNRTGGRGGGRRVGGKRGQGWGLVAQLQAGGAAPSCASMPSASADTGSLSLTHYLTHPSPTLLKHSPHRSAPSPLACMHMAMRHHADLPPPPPSLPPAGGADHIFLISHDEGACWAPKEIINSTILQHWGRMDINRKSETGYIADNFDAEFVHPTLLPDGWLKHVKHHVCFDPVRVSGCCWLCCWVRL
jgi:hypothetical protein